RRGFRRVIVAGEHEHAAVLRGASKVRVLEDVAATVDARSLAIPHGEHAIDLRVRVQVDLLRAPDGGRGKVLVQTGLKLDVGAIQKFLRLPQREVERAERRATVSRNESSRIEPGELVALALQDEQ